ncbi:hypothetical protein R84B8_02546 [Treponema sp. R8-4-B8]
MGNQLKNMQINIRKALEADIAIMTSIYNESINILSKENRRLIILNVLKIAPWSIDFYKKNGFKIYDSSISYNEKYNILKTRIVNNWELMMYKWI